jgi:hypothetical protein
MARLFISQERLDAWTTEQRVAVDGNRMTLADDGRSFLIRPAVRFVKVSGPDGDPHDLIGKVKDEKDLAAMGADHYMNSVIMGETAYDVQPGFLGDPTRRNGPGG